MIENKNKKNKKERNLRAEKHVIKDNKLLDELAFKAKNLYNLANYYVRQAFFLANKEELKDEQKEIIDFINSIISKYNDNKKEEKKMQHISKEKSYLYYNFMDFFMKNAGFEDNPYRMLPAATSQQILKILEQNWKSFFASIKDYGKNPEKYLGRPKPPKYLHKEKGRFNVTFTNAQCKIIDGYIKFPNKLDISVKTHVKQEQLKQVRIVPKRDHYVI